MKRLQRWTAALSAGGPMVFTALLAASFGILVGSGPAFAAAPAWQDDDGVELIGGFDLEDDEEEVDLPPELAAAWARRNLDPDDPEAAAALSVALGEYGDVDGQVAYLLYAIDALERAESSKEIEDRLKELRKDLRKVGKAVAALGGQRDSYVEELIWALRLYANNQGKLRNALHVAAQILLYSPEHLTANRVVAEVLEKADADLRAEAERLLSRKELSRSRSFLVDWAEKHKDWRKAGLIETPRYKVKTNIDFQTGMAAARSLDQIAEFFAEYYGVDSGSLHGQTDVYLTRRRAEFEDVSKHPIAKSPGVQAFISYGWRRDRGKNKLESQIYGFDPRDEGRSLASLWPTLWHEASHQYMAAATEGKRAPLWLNEGMSSYFEGARMTDDFGVDVGLPAMDRLEVLVSIFNHTLDWGRDEAPLEDEGGEEAEGSEETTPGEPEEPQVVIDSGGSGSFLEGLVSVGHDKFLNGMQYSGAWGITYYLRHGRDETGRRLRPGALSGLLRLVRAEAEITPRELFDTGVLALRDQTLEEFESEWRTWILDLHERAQDPKALAAELAALGTARAKEGEKDLAHGLFEEALLWDPYQFEALLGEAQFAIDAWEATSRRDDGLADEALIRTRRIYEAAVEAENEEWQDKAAELCNSIDGAGFKRIQSAESKYRRKVRRLIETALSNGSPQTALAVADLYLDKTIGGDFRDRFAQRLREEGTLVLKRPFAAFNGTSLMGLSGSPSKFQVKDGELHGSVERPERAPLYVERELTPRFALEGEFRLADSNTILGFCYSTPEMPQVVGAALRPKKQSSVKPPMFGFPPFDRVPTGRVVTMRQEFRVDYGGTEFRLARKSKRLGVSLEAGNWYSFRWKMTEMGYLELEIDDEVVCIIDVPEQASASSVGLLLYGGDMQLRNLVAVDMDRL